MPGGRAIGIDGVLNCKVAEVPIDSGDRIVLYTDGIIEAMSPSGQMYGSRNFMNTIKSSDHLGARELADLILSQLFKWTGRSKNLDDDFSLVIVDVR
jgi:serine phosphatase RsbU (regulator of sigma subunit)